MIMKKLALISILSIFLVTGCTKDGTPTSFFLNVDKTAVSVDNNVKPKRTGSACSYAVWPWVTLGDSSVNSARNNGRIKKVATLDKSHFSVFTWTPAGWFIRTCAEVSGE